MKLNLSIFLILTIASCQSNNTVNNKHYADLTNQIDSIVKANDFNGVVLLAQDSNIIYKKAFGYSDLENKKPLNADDQFYIGSISKQITAVLVMMEYEKGNLLLTDKVSKYFPEITQPWSNEITIHQLLTHTHGIVDINEPLEFEAGTQFHYSQIGFGLLAQILQKITNKTFEELSTELFTKYGLNNTFHPDNKKYTHLVKGYEEDENGQLLYAVNSLVQYIAAGGFISNTDDLLKWNQLLYSGKLVNENTLNLMSTRYATRIHPIFDKIEYGYGLTFKDGEQNTQIGAFGYVPGFPAACYYYRQSRMNLIVLGNTARNLDDFKITFKVHTDLINLIKNEPAIK